MDPGRMTEWFKVTVLKTVVGKPTVGSNPTPSVGKSMMALLHPKCAPRWASSNRDTLRDQSLQMHN